MNRRLRTLLPSSSKLHYDKSARDLQPLLLGQCVRLYQNKSWSRIGKVIQVGPELRSYHILTDKDTIVRRNRRHLLPTNEPLVLNADEDDDLNCDKLNPSTIEENNVQWCS